MFRNREEIRRRFLEIVEKFREKGATIPEKAMSSQELGLPPRFEEAMHRRLGQTEIFVEVNGKYYLNEERLKQLQEQRQKADFGGGSGWSPRRTMMTLRIARLGMTISLVILLLVNVFVQSWEIRLASTVFLVAWIVLLVAYIYYASRAKKRFSQFRSSVSNIFPVSNR